MASVYERAFWAATNLMALPKRIIKVCAKITDMLQETERLIADPAPGIKATPHEDNLRYFDVEMAGPSQSPFEGMCIQV